MELSGMELLSALPHLPALRYTSSHLGKITVLLITFTIYYMLVTLFSALEQTRTFYVHAGLF